MLRAFNSLRTRGAKVFLALGIIWLLGLIAFERRTRALHLRSAETVLNGTNTDLSLAPLTALELENDRLRREVSGLPELKASLERLRTPAAASAKDDSEYWTTQSNALIAAIERTQQDLQEIRSWSKEWEKNQRREGALRRLEEKAGEKGTVSEAGHAQMEERLGKLGLAWKHLLDIRGEWAEAQKDPNRGPEMRQRLKEAQESWWNAHQALGKDSALYEEIPLPADRSDPAKIPLMRSIFSDGNGLFTTVYLDGRVEFTREERK